MTSGEFCDTPGTYTLHFDAQFDRPFRRFATWQGARVFAGPPNGHGRHSGATVTFDTTRDRVVNMKVGISFVSIANARANLASETARLERRHDRPRRDRPVERRCSAASRSTAVPRPQRQTFYSALYHSLLEPNVFSDVNGEYPGFDHKVHTARGYTQYANFSGWDIYRSEVQLLSLLEPRETGDMMHSLLGRLRAERMCCRSGPSPTTTAPRSTATRPIRSSPTRTRSASATSTRTRPCGRW